MVQTPNKMFGYRLITEQVYFSHTFNTDANPYTHGWIDNRMLQIDNKTVKFLLSNKKYTQL